MPIPTFIINRDLLTWPKLQVEWMLARGLEPIIVDNNSSYQPLLDWYDTKPCEVVRLGYNGGHMVVFNSGLIQQRVKDYYIITDPDLEVWTLPDDTIDKLLEGHKKFPAVHKVGLAIQIDDIPDEYPLKAQVGIWETPFWAAPLGNDFYDAALDTTFSLYHRDRSMGYTLNAVRTGGPYTVRHLPFYLTPQTMNDELAYYMTHCDKGVSTQARYLEPMVNEYLRKQNEKDS